MIYCHFERRRRSVGLEVAYRGVKTRLHSVLRSQVISLFGLQVDHLYLRVGNIFVTIFFIVRFTRHTTPWYVLLNWFLARKCTLKYTGFLLSPFYFIIHWKTVNLEFKDEYTFCTFLGCMTNRYVKFTSSTY